MKKTYFVCPCGVEFIGTIRNYDTHLNFCPWFQEAFNILVKKRLAKSFS